MAIIPGIPGKVVDKIITTLGLQSAVDKLPVDLVPTIQPVMEVKPDVVIDVIEFTSTTGTFYTTPTDRDFFLTNCLITSQSKDQSANVDDYVTVVLESGQSTELIKNRLGSGVASENNASVSEFYNVPIKLKRGSAVALNKGSSTVSAYIKGYLVD